MTKSTAPTWMSAVLRFAGAYNLLWGFIAVLFPTELFRWAGMELPRYPELWQCIGMIVGVYGIGYWIAAGAPFVHWPIVLVGLLGKIFGPIGFAVAVYRGSLPLEFGATILTNDLIWWIPFAAILWGAIRFHTEPTSASEDHRSAMSTIRGDNGSTLAELSESRPVLTVFLRHAGCTFHRQTLADLHQARESLASEGVQVALVHMSRGQNPCQRNPEYGLNDAIHFSDPSCRLYREFGLERGSFWQLFGPRVWKLGFQAFLQGHRLGKLVGDGLQMPGVFLVKEGRVVNEYRHQTAGDRPNYHEIARGYA